MEQPVFKVTELGNNPNFESHPKYMKLQNDLLIRAATGESVERTPVWLMRQAGRTLPEYLKVRSSVKNFHELLRNPELAAEVSQQPVDILGVDAAIIFSDILVIPDAMGLPYRMVESVGPVFDKNIRSENDMVNLRIADEYGYGYVIMCVCMCVYMCVYVCVRHFKCIFFVVVITNLMDTHIHTHTYINSYALHINRPQTHV